MKKYIVLIFIFAVCSIYANNYDSMIKSMQLENIEELSISDENSTITITFNQLAEYYASIVTDKNATPEQLEALGNIIKMWTDTINQNFSKEEIFTKYSTVTSTLSSMSILLILRIAIKEKINPKN